MAYVQSFLRRAYIPGTAVMLFMWRPGSSQGCHIASRALAMRATPTIVPTAMRTIMSPQQHATQ